MLFFHVYLQIYFVFEIKSHAQHSCSFSLRIFKYVLFITTLKHIFALQNSLGGDENGHLVVGAALPRPELVLWKATSLVWPAKVLRRVDDKTKILILERKKRKSGAEQRFDRICSAGWPIEEPGSASSLQGGQQYVEIDLSATGAILQKSLKITDFGTILSNHKAINSKILQNIPNQAPEHLLPLCGSGRGTPPRHLVRTEPVAKVWNNLLCRWATNCWLNLYNFYFRSPLTLSVPFERLARYNHSFCHRCNFTKVTQYYCLQHHCYQVKAIYSKIWSFSC